MDLSGVICDKELNVWCSVILLKKQMDLM
jgi:hypothetical protein